MRFEKDRIPIRVAAVYSSKYPDRSYNGDDYFVTEARNQLELTCEGIIGDRHFGYTTISGGRFTTLYDKGTIVRNNRQWSAISPAEIEKIATNLGISGRLTPELLGINFLLEGLENLSALPPMSYIVLSPHEDFQPKRSDDVALVVYGQALPCTTAGRALIKPFDDPSLESKFPAAALGVRGTTGWVEKGGIIRPEYHGWILTPKGID